MRVRLFIMNGSNFIRCFPPLTIQRFQRFFNRPVYILHRGRSCGSSAALPCQTVIQSELLASVLWLAAGAARSRNVFQYSITGSSLQLSPCARLIPLPRASPARARAFSAGEQAFKSTFTFFPIQLLPLSHSAFFPERKILWVSYLPFALRRIAQGVSFTCAGLRQGKVKGRASAPRLGVPKSCLLSRGGRDHLTK